MALLGFLLVVAGGHRGMLPVELCNTTRKSQSFTFNSKSQIVDLEQGRCWNSFGGHIGPGGQLQMFGCSDNPDEYFSIQKNQIIMVAAPKTCVGAKPKAGAILSTVLCNDTSIVTQWVRSSSTGAIQLHGTNLCVDADNDQPPIPHPSPHPHPGPSPHPHPGPSPHPVPCPPWTPSVRDKATALVRKMTLKEKVSMLPGLGWRKTYTGLVDAIVNTSSGVRIPPLKLNDGPQGFRAQGYTGSSTQWPAAINVAASFDVAMAKRWGEGMGKEFYDKGSNVQLGPGLCLARIPTNGRNFEYLSGEDPFLGYTMVQPVVRGIQSNKVVSLYVHILCVLSRRKMMTMLPTNTRSSQTRNIL